MTGIQGIDLGTFVASTDAASRTRQTGDGTQQRHVNIEAAAYVERRNDAKRITVEKTEDGHLVKRQDPDDDSGSYDDHGRRNDDQRDDEPEERAHIDIAV